MIFEANYIHSFFLLHCIYDFKYKKNLTLSHPFLACTLIGFVCTNDNQCLNKGTCGTTRNGICDCKGNYDLKPDCSGKHEDEKYLYDHIVLKPTKSLSKQNGYAPTISPALIMENVVILHMEYVIVREDMDQQLIAMVSPCTY